jgi:Mn-containing catalase
VRSLPRCTTVGCSEKSILLFSPYFTTLSVVVRVCIRKPVNKGFSADFAKWNISDASVGTEELGHLEMIGALVHQLTRNLNDNDVRIAEFAPYFVDHTTGVYPTAASGFPWSAASIGVKGDVIGDLTEDMAAEQKARITYDNILRLSDDPDVNDVIRFLREREVVHFQRFGETKRTRWNGTSKSC